ncbi:ArsR family transcriptional regulator [Actinoalloteichus sp. AHMU CJ021]|uniref:winged helix-turn-helix domain-containing protein n=1 Tax=Actinoalloteichus sp. AHMU CJ021 TaxID=2072503 RepID=UPI000CA004D1|nr:ArsR family transcriptional regulator [Actinoalloteichus sp. AHMU CJ021]
MRSIHFDGTDLTRVTVLARPDPLLESLFALAAVADHRPDAAFGGWRDRTLRNLRARSSALVALARSVRPVPDLLVLVRSRGASSRRQQLSEGLREFHETAVAPYWPRVAALAETETNSRAHMVINEGVERLLGTLHRDVRWTAPVLEIPGIRKEKIMLGGRGITLAPSVFLAGRSTVLVPPTKPGGPLVLAYPAPVEWAVPSALTPTMEGGERSLAALVGRTRAAILIALSESRTTSELSRRIGISAAAASQHTAILREAGMITTYRQTNTALHSLTPLGLAVRSGREYRINEQCDVRTELG